MAESGAPERIRILYASTATSFAPIWITGELGIYKKHGLDAQVVLLGGGPLVASQAKRVLGANAKRSDLTIDDVIDKNFVGVVR